MTTTITGYIRERGNGLADVGDYVGDSDALYRVLSTGIIQTGEAPGRGHRQRATVVEAEWADLSDAEADDVVCTFEPD